MQSRNTHRQSFPSFEEDIAGASWTSTGDKIELASQALLANGDNGAVRVVFVAYHQLNKLLSMAYFQPEYENRLHVIRHQNGGSGMIVSGSAKSQSTPDSTFLNSKIVCASLGRGRHIELPEPVVITLKHLKRVDQGSNLITNSKSSKSLRKVQGSSGQPSKLVPKCVYWDYLSNDWSHDGCKVLETNQTHTRCQCNHLTNFALLMSTEGGDGSVLDSAEQGDLQDNSRYLYSSGRYDIRAVASSPVEKAPMMSKNVSTIVASIATLVSVSIIVFFIIIAWQKMRVSTQCRSALNKSGLPCFHKGGIDGNHGVNGGRNGNGNNNGNIDDNATEADSESAAGGKNKGEKGNFYTVTPKLTFNFNRLSSSGNNNGSNNNNASTNNGNTSEDDDGETPELVEAQQFFEHMIALQKNQDNMVAGNGNTNKNSRRASANLSNINENPNPEESCDDEHIKLNNIKPTNSSQRISQQIVMNNLQSSNPNGVISPQNNEIIYPKRNNYARALSPYNHIYMEIPDGININGNKDKVALSEQQQALAMPVYEPLSHLSETYMMSTMSDLSEDNYNQGIGMNYNSDVSRQSSHRESRPLLRNKNLTNGHSNMSNFSDYASQATNGQQRNLLQTISGVLHSQSVRLSHGNNVTHNQSNDNSNIGMRGASLHHINDGSRKGNRGFATLHYPPNHFNTRKSVIGMPQGNPQQPHSFVNGSNQRASSFMVHGTPGNIITNNVNGNMIPLSRLNGSTIVNSSLNSDRIISIDPVTGQAVAYNANCREELGGQPTYISSSLSDGGMFLDGSNFTTNGVQEQATGNTTNKLTSGMAIVGKNNDVGVTPGEYVRQLLQQHRKNNAPNNSSPQHFTQNAITSTANPLSQVTNNVSISQPAQVTSNAGPVSLPQPQFAHPIASATAAKI